MAFRTQRVWVCCRICGNGDDTKENPLIYDFERDDGSWIHASCRGKEMAEETFAKIKKLW